MLGVTKSESRFRVRYAETDAMGIVHHANYLVWMEIARTELCKLRGVRYRDFEQATGLSMAVVGVECRYHRAAKYDDEILATAWLKTSHPRMVVFAYEMRNGETGELLASGETKHVLISREGRPARIPPAYYGLFDL
jgi:acyl-CoA thioester hydrolase